MIKFYTEMEIKTAKEERTVEFIASKEIVDRDGDIVKVAGIDIKNYKKDPVVLWAHDHRGLPVAKSIRTWKTRDGLLKIKPQFPEMEVYAFADTVYKLVKGGYLNTVSIGFIPNYEKIEHVDPKKNKGASRIYNEVELLEVSIVPVPSNPEALIQSRGITKALADNVIDELELQELLDYCSRCDCKEETDIVEKPYKGEHSCRLEDPKKYKKFRRVNNATKIDGKSVDHIYGILSPKKSELQAIRFPVKNWTAVQAKKHCEGTFEAAKKAVEGTKQTIVEPQIIEIEVRDAAVEKKLGKELQEAQIKIAQLELELYDKQVEKETKNDTYEELFNAFQGDSSEQEADVDQTEKWVKDALNILEEKK